MKKTLIMAVMAAATVAFGTTLDDNVLLQEKGAVAASTDISGLGSGAFSYTVTLTETGVNTLTGAVGQAPDTPYAQSFISLQGNSGTFGVGQGYSSGWVGGVKVIHTSALYMCANTANGAIGSYQGGSIIVKDATTDIFANAEKVALTFTAVGNARNGTHMYLSVQNTDGTTATYSSTGDSDFMWGAFSTWATLSVNTSFIESVALFDSVLSETDALAVNSALIAAAMTPVAPDPDPNPGSGSIPEPATATLSLLALAGLAARRRRK